MEYKQEIRKLVIKELENYFKEEIKDDIKIFVSIGDVINGKYEVEAYDADTGEKLQQFELNQMNRRYEELEVDDYIENLSEIIAEGKVLITKDVLIQVKGEMMADMANGWFIMYEDEKFLLEPV